MKEFLEKWKSDNKFKAKIKLGLYTLFVVVVSIFALSLRPEESLNDTPTSDDIKENIQNNPTIEIPNKYNYNIDITVNDKKYQYNGIKETKKETISKIIDNVTTNYLYQDNNYYKEENNEYILTTKESVYDIINYDYINLEIINQYLSKSKKENEIYKTYLKDIILGNNSEEYITITIDNNNITIDYTSLIKYFDEKTEKYLIEIEIKGNE